MTEFRIIEGQAHHCGAIVRRLREGQRTALIGLGVNPHREIRKNFDASAWRRAWLVDGRLAALGGVTGPLIATGGYVWFAMSQQGQRHPIAVARMVRQQLAELMQIKCDLYTTLLPEDTAAIRFADWLGFESAHNLPVPYGTGRVIAIRYRIPVAEAA